MNHPSGIKAEDIAEYMTFNLGQAFTALWNGELEKALEYMERHDSQRGPIPMIPGMEFRIVVEPKKIIFNRPSPWCEPVRYAIAALCDLCSSGIIAERSRLTLRIIGCIKTAIEDDKCMGQGLQP